MNTWATSPEMILELAFFSYLMGIEVSIPM
jgi:hypothetical protein